MRSEKTFFDPAIYRRALSRFWLLGAAYAAALCFLALVCGRYMEGSINDSAEYISYTILQNMTRRMSVAAAVGAVVMAVAVHGWMFRKTSAAYIAALPVRREALLISSMLAGLTLLILPCAAMTLVTLLLYGGYGPLYTAYLLRSALVVTLMNTAFFGIASFCTAFTGNIAVLPGIYAILLYAFVGIEVVCRYIAEFLLFGVMGKGWKLAVLSPVYYISNWYMQSFDTQAIPFAAIYAAAGVIFAGLAVIFFRRRSMEAAGEVIAIPALRPLFRWGLAAAVSFAMALLLLKTVFNYAGGYYVVSGGATPGRVALLLLAMIVGAAIGWFGAEALMRKTLRVFDRDWKGLGVLCAILCIVIIGGDLDILGIESYQPEAGKISYASVYGWGVYSDTRLMQPENIEKVLELQKSILSHKKEYEGSYGLNNLVFPLEIRYYGADGDLLSRRTYVYTYPASQSVPYVTGGSYCIGNAAPDTGKGRDIRLYEAIINTREMVEQRTLYPRDRSQSTIFTTNIQWYTALPSTPVQQGLNLTVDEFWELYDTCIVPDLRDGNIGQLRIVQDEKYFTEGEPIRIYATGVYTTAEGEYSYDTYEIQPTASSERTNAWLREHGVLVQTLAEAYGIDVG